jgi:sugar lactone lactonase YvrE
MQTIGPTPIFDSYVGNRGGIFPFEHPDGIAVSSNGTYFYVVDSYHHRVHRFQADAPFF